MPVRGDCQEQFVFAEYDFTTLPQGHVSCALYPESASASLRSPFHPQDSRLAHPAATVILLSIVQEGTTQLCLFCRICCENEDHSQRPDCRSSRKCGRQSEGAHSDCEGAQTSPAKGLQSHHCGTQPPARDSKLTNGGEITRT